MAFHLFQPSLFSQHGKSLGMMAETPKGARPGRLRTVFHLTLSNLTYSRNPLDHHILSKYSIITSYEYILTHVTTIYHSFSTAKNIVGATPLHLAHSPGLVKLLLRYKAKPIQRNQEGLTGDFRSPTRIY